MPTAVLLAIRVAFAQDLTPRAYLITPTGSNAVTLAYSFSEGSIFSDPAVPITDFKARIHTQIFSYYHAFPLLGRSAHVAASVPYVRGTLQGIVAGAENYSYRSGLTDLRIRISVNLLGAPEMPLAQFLDWREKTTVGVSLTAVAPTGQYDPARLINPGLHRWAVKPEIGLSRRYGKWTLNLYGGGWFFTANSRFAPGESTRSQAPVAAGEAHLIRHLTPRCWLSLDGNYWTGGRTKVDHIRKADYQRNSRVGATFAIPVTGHQSLKFSYSRGAYIAIGGDYRNVSMAWQYSWIGRLL
jgi:hypothetical protein